jgi:hypothetical protein
MNKKIALLLLATITLFTSGTLPRALLVKKWKEEKLAYISTVIV